MQKGKTITYLKNLEYLAQKKLEEERSHSGYLISCQIDGNLGFVFATVCNG